MATTSNSSATPSLATTPATTPTALTTAATTAKRLGYTSPSSSSATASVICEEVFDEACLPSAEEINDYATLIGIEPSKETHLLYLAKEGLMAALPAEWKICYSEEKSGHYYHNTRTKQSQWDHPLDAVYRELVEQTRHKLQSTTGVATPVIDNSEDMSQLDSGIRSMQGNDELLEDQTSNSQQQGMAAVGAGLGVVGKSSTAGLPASGAGTALGGGFSGGVSRFLETRAKNFGGNFQPVKNTRFEVAKISLAMKFAQPSPTTTTAVESGAPVRKTGFQLSGSGAMFLKSRRQLEQPQVTPSTGSVELPKGILRDSSLTDMRRRGEREEDAPTVAGEDKKSVRFNLEQTVRIRSSSEADEREREREQEPQQTVEQEEEEEEQDDDSKLCSSSEEQAEEQQEAEELEDAEELEPEDLEPEEQGGDLQHDLWDEHVAMCRLKPYISDANKTIRVINLPKAQTIQMLEEVGANSSSCSSYLDKLKESAAAAVKPLYEDTDSDSKGSSVRSFIVNKSELENAALQHSNPFDLDALGRQHSHELEQLQRKSAQATQLNTDKLGLRSLKMASKLVGLLKQQEQSSSSDSDMLNEAAALQQLQQDMQSIKREHEVRLKSLRHEYELRLTSHRHQLEETFALQLAEYRLQLEQQLQLQRVQVVTEHKTHMATLQSNHAELLHELERDLASEQELLRREHAAKLQQQRDKHAHELEVERQRLRETGEERMYEKLRCEKRLLEDKYRCLKEKYVRLKTDVKLSLERRSRRREAQAQAQALQQHHNHHHHATTNSETERSSSQKPSIGNSENRSLSYTERGVGAVGASGAATGGATGVGTPAGSGVKLKPPVPPKTHLSKPNVASKYLQQLQDDNNTSLSQSDTTISNNYSKGRYLAVATPTATPTPTPTVTPSASGSASAVVLSDNGNSDSEAIALALHSQHQEHNNNNHNNNNNVNNNKCLLPRKKLFSRTKSASTSRLNADNYRPLERPCTPVENLRHQLQKLEDLEDQFPEHTLEATYHLRYPFTDMGNEQLALLGTVVGSELEFFKHRIHLERDAVRRAKDSLRTQRNSFRARQREIRQRHKSLQLVATAPRQCLDQLMLEEKELSEMEVNLHRTRALLGEKVIRLRQLEQSLWRICEQEQPALELDVKEEAATLSDLSSHSSSGFSSTDFASGADLHKRKEYFQQESNECIQNLEILNAEIREILDILSQKQLHQQQQHQQSSLPSLMAPNELSWSHMLGQQSSSSHMGAAAASAAAGSSSSAGAAASSSSAAAVAPLVHAPQSIPTLADRLETYRQLAAGRMHSSMGGAILAANTIVSQSPRAVNYTTSLVERTRDLRNWLRQAKTEHELLTGMGLSMQSTGAAGASALGGIGAAVGGTQPTAATATPSASGGGVAASAAASATEAAQTNL